MDYTQSGPWRLVWRTTSHLDPRKSLGAAVNDAPGVQQSPAELQAELDAFDLKIYRAQCQMNEAMTLELKALGVPFFGTSLDRIVPDDQDVDKDADRLSNTKGSPRITHVRTSPLVTTSFRTDRRQTSTLPASCTQTPTTISITIQETTTVIAGAQNMSIGTGTTVLIGMDSTRPLSTTTVIVTVTATTVTETTTITSSSLGSTVLPTLPSSQSVSIFPSTNSSSPVSEVTSITSGFVTANATAFSNTGPTAPILTATTSAPTALASSPALPSVSILTLGSDAAQSAASPFALMVLLGMLLRF
ncbi:hypothetical protein ANO11243_021010 [Dothideomycetidae sp. 11243]|nr:hypothetical protein ANO11243_021010 [fungal sp. No.11243]